MKVKSDLEKLLSVGAHFGHQARRWNPSMEPYLYGVQDGVHVFDLPKTKELFDEALVVIDDASKKEKVILIVGTKKQSKEHTEELAKKHGLAYVSERWLGGTLTNFEQMRKSVKKLAEMKEKVAAGEYKNLTKKEQLLKDREIKKLEKKFGGVSGLEKKPELIIIIDTKREAGAVAEAKHEGIEIVGLVDSNADPTSIDYPVPLNDDSSQTLGYVFELFDKALTRRASAKQSKAKKKTAKKKAKK